LRPTPESVGILRGKIRRCDEERRAFVLFIFSLEGETMKSTRLVIAIAAIFGVVGAAQAGGDATAGKAKAAACAGCHGANGEGKAPNPALAGKAEDQMVQAMKDYKSGKRNNPVMKTFAGPLTEQDMANLAAYYSSLKK
jgi:cytochrome c553